MQNVHVHVLEYCRFAQLHFTVEPVLMALHVAFYCQAALQQLQLHIRCNPSSPWNECQAELIPKTSKSKLLSHNSTLILAATLYIGLALLTCNTMYTMSHQSGETSLRCTWHQSLPLQGQYNIVSEKFNVSCHKLISQLLSETLQYMILLMS